MATSQKAKTVNKEELVEDTYIEKEVEQTIEKKETINPKQLKEKSKKDTWEIKDRTYHLKGNIIPLTFTLNSKHSLRYPLMWFDEESGEQKEIRYATNQNSPLVSEQKGQCTLGHIIFRDGVLTVPKTKQNLQKLLSIYHPSLNKKYYEFNPIANAEDDLEELELEVQALNMALEMEIDQAESIVRVEVGSRVNKMSSKEIRRDLLLLARRNSPWQVVS